MPFKFAGNAEVVDKQLLTDLKALNRISVKDYSTIIQKCLQAHKDIGNMHDDDSVSKFARNLCENEIEDTSVLKAKTLTRLLKSLFYVIIGAIKYNLSETSLSDDLSQIGLNEEYRKIFCNEWRNEYVKLNRSVIEQSTLHLNQVVDMQWKFGVTASSDSLKQLGSTFLQLKLVLDKGNNCMENVVMGMECVCVVVLAIINNLVYFVCARI